MKLAFAGVQVFSRSIYAKIAECDENYAYKIEIAPSSVVVEDLLFWSSRLSDHERYNGQPIKAMDHQVKLYVDASDLGWGGQCEDQQYSGTIEINHIGASSTNRELYGLLQIANRAIDKLRDKNILVLMDSYPAIRNLINGGGNKSDLTEMVKQWHTFCEKHHISPTYQWIERDQNTVADRASKLASQNLTLYPTVHYKIQQWFKDLTAEEPRLQEVAIFCPSFNHVNERLEAIKTQMPEGIIVVPEWENQTWMKNILRSYKNKLRLGKISEVIFNRLNTTHDYEMAAYWIDGKRAKRLLLA
jgi:hypothetical protein